MVVDLKKHIIAKYLDIVKVLPFAIRTLSSWPTSDYDEDLIEEFYQKIEIVISEYI